MTDELLDVVDLHDIVIRQDSRSVVHQQGLWHRGVHVFLFAADGKLLLQKRSRDRSSFPSAWDCSVSEHVRAGESYLDAAVRGLGEELGITGIDLQAVIRFKMNYGPNDNEISTLYKGIVDPVLIRFDPVEIERVECLAVEDLLKWMSRERASFAGWFVQLMDWSQRKASDVSIINVFSEDRLFPQ